MALDFGGFLSQTCFPPQKLIFGWWWLSEGHCIVSLWAKFVRKKLETSNVEQKQKLNGVEEKLLNMETLGLGRMPWRSLLTSTSLQSASSPFVYFKRCFTDFCRDLWSDVMFLFLFEEASVVQEVHVQLVKQNQTMFGDNANLCKEGVGGIGFRAKGKAGWS